MLHFYRRIINEDFHATNMEKMIAFFLLLFFSNGVLIWEHQPYTFSVYRKFTVKFTLNLFNDVNNQIIAHTNENEPILFFDKMRFSVRAVAVVVLHHFTNLFFTLNNLVVALIVVIIGFVFSLFSFFAFAFALLLVQSR